MNKSIYGIVAIFAVLMMVFSAIPIIATDASDNLMDVNATAPDSFCTIEFERDGGRCDVNGMVWTQKASKFTTIHLPSALLYKYDTINEYNEYGVLTTHYTPSFQTGWKLKETGEEYALGQDFSIKDSMVGTTIHFQPIWETVSESSEKEPVVLYFELDRSTGGLKNYSCAFSEDLRQDWEAFINPSDIWYKYGYTVAKWDGDYYYTQDYEKFRAYTTIMTGYMDGNKLINAGVGVSSSISYSNPDHYKFKVCAYRHSEPAFLSKDEYSAPVNVMVCIYEGQYQNKLTYMNDGQKLDEVKNIQFGNSIILATPGIQKSGYKLVGWRIPVSESREATFPLGSIFDFQGKDYVATAVWEANPNILVLNANGGKLKNESGTILPYIVNTGQSFLLNSQAEMFQPPSDKYELQGWYSGLDKGVYAKNYAVPITKTTILNAYWVEKGSSTFTITYNANGGSIEGNTTRQIVNQKDSVVLPQILHGTGNQVFDGWETPSGQKVTSPYRPTGNIELKATWREGEPTDKYEVTFNTGETMWTTFVSIGDRIERPKEIPTKETAYFVDWVDTNGEPFDFSRIVTQEMVNDGFLVINARWQQVFDVKINDMKVTVILDESVGAMIAEINWDIGEESKEFSGEISHTYTGEGNYTIQVTVYELGGGSHTVSKLVTVSQGGGGGGGDDPEPPVNTPDTLTLILIVIGVIVGVIAIVFVARYII